jgi:Mg2+ and Co2+ transporter CorA
MQASIQMLRKENEDLQDQLTVVQAASIDDIQKEQAESIIRDLRAQLRAAEIELKEMTISRDMYQRENGELKKQVTSLLKKLKKLEG